jgi:predicted dehydrogenase
MPGLRGAIVGCGMIAEYHLRAWHRIPEVEIAALCDPDLARAVDRQRHFAPQARCYGSLADALSAERIDFVDILSPPWLHREHCLEAARAGVHIICQKPLCGELVEARSLVAELAGYPRLFAVHENHPYRPWFRELLRRAEDGFFGDLRRLSLVQHDAREPPERFKAEAERGIMLEYGVHLVDMVRKLLGEPQRVQASFGRVNERVRGESLAAVIYECENAAAVIDISWKTAGPELGSVTLIGECGLALYEGRMTRGAKSRFRLFQQGQVVFDEERCPTADFGESFYLLQRELTGAMRSGSEPPQAASDNLKTLEATFAAYDAAAWQAGRSAEDPAADGKTA